MPRFQPGQSGNPAGRPKSLIRTARILAGPDVARAVTLLRLIALGSDAELKAFAGEHIRRTTKDRIAAANALLTRLMDCPRKHADNDDFADEVRALVKLTTAVIQPEVTRETSERRIAHQGGKAVLKRRRCDESVFNLPRREPEVLPQGQDRVSWRHDVRAITCYGDQSNGGGIVGTKTLIARVGPARVEF